MRTLRPRAWASVVAFVPFLAASGAFAQAPPSVRGAPPPAYPPAASPPPPAYPPPSPGPALYPPPGLQPPFSALVAGPIVRLRANNPRARLQMMQLRWADVCSVPCGGTADPAGLYRIAGGTIRPSESFKLPRPSGEVFIDAQVGSNIKRWVGFGLGVGGAASAGLGLLYLTAFSQTRNDTFGETTSNIYRATGIVYLVVGVVLMAVGIPMWATSNTSVDVR